MKRIYTLLVAAMAAVCGALADDVTITEVEFSLDVSKIDYFAGNFEGNVQDAITKNISVASDAEYTLTSKSLCFVRDVTGVQAVNRGVALIGANASREYLVFVTLTPKEGYTFSDTDYASISVKWNGSSVTPHFIGHNSYGKFIEVAVKLGAWATSTVATHTLTVANATYNDEDFTGGSVAEGVKLTLTANTAATGYKFSGWNCTGITLDDATSNVAKFTMPANDVTIEATYVEQVVETLTAVTFTLPIDEIEYQIGVKESTVLQNIKSKTTIESSDKYGKISYNFGLLYKTTGGSFSGVGNDETTIGTRTDFYDGKEEYYACIVFKTSSDAIIFTPDASALTVTYNGAVITPTKVESKGRYLFVYIPLGDPAAAAETLYTLTCVNAAPESYPYQTFSGGDYAEGASVTFRAKTPNAGEQFDHWEATGITLSEEQKTAELLTITMPANAVTITAVYKKIDYKIIIADDIKNGEVSVTSGTATANYGDEVALTVTPATGYELEQLEVKWVSGGTVTVSEDYKFTMPNAHVKISATFKKVNYTITIASDIANGEVSVTSGAATAQMGDEVALTITPATGYELDVLSVKNESGGTVTLSEDYKFTMPASNVTVTATFKAVTPTALQTAELMGIYAENGRIYGTDGMQIFTLTGQNVTEMNGSLCGVYIVKVGEKAQKVFVK